MTYLNAGPRAAAIASLLVATLVACDTGAPTEPRSLATQSSSNAAAADACQDGGYANLVRADGSSFKNVGDCVSYAAQGGSFAPSITSLVLSGYDCDTASYTAVFSGGTGVVAGQTVYSGVEFTLSRGIPVILVVTNEAGASVTATGPGAPLDGSCLS